MQNILDVANNYGKTMTWQRMTLFKTCCIAFGVLVGTWIPKEERKTAISLASVLFFLTYIPLMFGFFQSWCSSHDEE